MSAHNEGRERVLKAAWELFANAGYKAATVEAIARSAGMAKGSFYLHFESKDEALFALVAKAGEGMAACTDALLAAPFIGVRALVQRYLEAVIQYREDFIIYKRLVFEASAFGSPTVVEALARLDGRVETELARLIGGLAERGHIAACDADLAATALVAAYSALVAKKDRAGQPLKADRIMVLIAALVSGGLIQELGA